MKRLIDRLTPSFPPRPAAGFPAVDVFEWRPKDGSRNFGDHLATVVTSKQLATRDRSLGEQGPKARRLFTVGSVIHFAEDGDCGWGSGRNGKIDDAAHHFTKLDVRAVRGPLTAEFLRGRGISAPDVFGDPALLIPTLFPGRFAPAPTIECLFVPNLHDLTRCPPGVPSVSPLLGWNRVTGAIMRARLVVASSLHGLVLAEAYGIPARYLRLSDSENLFKYRDYAAGTGRSTLEFATSLDQAREMGGMPPVTFDPQPLLDAFPWDLWD